MKTIALALIAMIFSTQAGARSMKTTLEAEMTKFYFQPGSNLDNMNITSGQVSIDFYHNKITLSLQPAWHCPGDKLFCAALMPAVEIKTLPLVSMIRGGCEEMVYTAMVDKLPVDGQREVITVTDNSTNTCNYFREIPVTEITYKIEGRFPQFNELHVMEAVELK